MASNTSLICPKKRMKIKLIKNKEAVFLGISLSIIMKTNFGQLSEIREAMNNNSYILMT